MARQMITPGMDFLQWLQEVGIVPEGSDARRVVIDAEVGKVVKVYVEMFGTEDILNVEPPPSLTGAKVTIIGGGGK